MEKTRKLSVFALFFMVIVLMVSFAGAEIQSIKNSYLSTEAVYVKSTAQLCRSVREGENVNLYIVQNQEWEDGDPLNDVRGDSQEVPNSIFSSKRIWDSPQAGDYDIVVDCIGNREYDQEEPVDSLFEIGFRVTVVAGKGRARLGVQDIGDHSWRYDPEEFDLTNEMLQLNLVAEGEDIALETITIRASGTGDDAEIDKLEIYADENNNGKVDDNDNFIADSQPAYTDDNGETTILLDYILTGGISENILIVYTMKETITEGEFSLAVESISGIGRSSDETIEFSGLPLSSGVKTVLPEKTCLGTLTLALNPNPVPKDSSVIAGISGISGCQNKEVVLRTNPCGSVIQDKVGSCILNEEDKGCDISFTSSTSETYHACIDKNADGDMVDFGEYDFEDLVIIEPEPEEEEIEEIENITEEANVTGEINITGEIEGEVEEIEEEGAGITGGVVGIKEKISETGSFFILLEITLLLILFVLVMILFRLKAPVKPEKEEEETEEE